MRIVLEIPDDKYQFFLELVESLNFVKVKDQEVLKESPYDHDFVDKIIKSDKEFEEGAYKRVEKKDLKNFLDL